MNKPDFKELQRLFGEIIDPLGDLYKMQLKIMNKGFTVLDIKERGTLLGHFFNKGLNLQEISLIRDSYYSGPDYLDFTKILIFSSDVWQMSFFLKNGNKVTSIVSAEDLFFNKRSNSLRILFQKEIVSLGIRWRDVDSVKLNQYKKETKIRGDIDFYFKQRKSIKNKGVYYYSFNPKTLFLDSLNSSNLDLIRERLKFWGESNNFSSYGFQDYIEKVEKLPRIYFGQNNFIVLDLIMKKFNYPISNKKMLKEVSQEYNKINKDIKIMQKKLSRI